MAEFAPIRFGKYQLIEKIATGGMAEVYKAKSYGAAGFEKLLVIKKILPHLSRNPEFVKMFINEAKIAVSLNHANVVQVYDLGVVDKDYYMAMEFIHGQDLMRIIKVGRKTRRFLPIPTGVYIITEAARGLDYAHTLTDPGGRPLNVVHQDVSPHNLLISYEGDVKLVDFGIARIGEVQEEEAEGGGRMAGGKFAYMAPEQAQGLSVDARSDIFAAGIILYELITGQRLYAGKDRQEKMRMVRNAEVPPPRTVNPEIPARLEEILMKALARDPDDRYQHARDLQEDLLSFLYDVGMRVTRADCAHFMKEMFADEYQRESAGSVVNAIVKDLSELEKPGFEPLPEVAVEDAAPGPGQDAAAPLQSGEWQAVDLSVSGVSTGTPGAPDLGARVAQGERRNVEVLAIEITGLTDISDRVGEEALLKLNYSFLKSLASLIRKYRGTITPSEPDRMLVFWGLEKSSSKDLELCVRCASDLRRLSEKFAEAKGETVHLSMGVHRGAVLVGPQEGKRRRRHRAYTPWGDTIKHARRLCELAGVDEVLVSEKVFGLLSEWGEFDPVPPATVKWAAGEIRPYRLRRLRGRGERGQAGRWVKRGEEFDLLKRILERAGEGRAAVLSVEGEAGSGKARFVREIREITRGKELAFYVGRGYFYRREVPFLPFREVLEQVCGFEEHEDDAARREKLLRLSELRLDPIDIHIIGQLFELDFPNSNIKYLSGDQIRIGTFEAIRKVLAGISTDRFLVLALENFQYLDPYSIELVAHLGRTLTDRKLLLVVTQPPKGELPFGDDVHLERLELPPLGREEVREFTMELLGTPAVPDGLLDFVVAQSGGNALFGKEIVGQLRRQGIVQIQEGRVVLSGKLEAAGLPASVEDLIASRIDALTPGERVVLEVAATIGRAFEKALLAEVVRMPGEELTEVLGRLQSMKLVRRIREGEQAGEADHIFRNNLCWEVTVRGILSSRNKEFHNRVAEAVERVKSENLRPHFEELSRHYQAGGLLRRASFFAEQAGLAYERTWFDREAMRCLQRAILLLRGSEGDEGESRDVSVHLADLYIRLGELQGRNVQVEDSFRSFSKAVEFAEGAEADATHGKALMRLGRAASALGRKDDAGLHLKQAQSIAEALQDSELATDADEELARWALDQGDFETARSALNRALAAARGRDDKVRVARILGSLGAYYMRAGDYKLSEKHLQTARELAMQTDDRILQGRLFNKLGVTYIHMERFELALDCYRQAGEIQKGIEYRRGVISNLHNVGDVYFRMGDFARAFQYFEESLKSARESDWDGGQAMNLVYLGYLQALRGELDEGEATLQDGIARALRVGDAENAGQGKVFLARVLTRRGDLERARQVLAEASGRGGEGTGGDAGARGGAGGGGPGASGEADAQGTA
jgi:class 3 adenylate cyclase/tetratricopeptide (TPR) repeat protein/tRNA A-37 threonylcarbamoyl transferase component Bud32